MSYVISCLHAASRKRPLAFYSKCQENLVIENGTVLYRYAHDGQRSFPQDAIYKCSAGYRINGLLYKTRNCKDIDGDGIAEWTDVGDPKCTIISIQYNTIIIMC